MRKALELVPQAPEQGPAPAALPEAPCSVNAYVSIGGRQVQVTLRGQHESEVLGRMAAVLAQYPIEASTTVQEGFCQKHGVQMQQTTKAGRSWWSHRQDGQWCKGK